MKVVVLLLLITALGFAYTVQADFIGVQETGNENLESLDVGVFIDCEEKDLRVAVLGEDSEGPISGASAYLFYTDYEYQLLATGTSDADGNAAITVPGSIDYLTALFILRVDKSGYRTKEVEFAYEKCFQDPPPAEPPAEEPPETEEPPIAELPEEDVGDISPPPAEETPEDETPPAENMTPPEEGDVAPVPEACPLGLAILSLLFIKVKA